MARAKARGGLKAVGERFTAGAVLYYGESFAGLVKKCMLLPSARCGKQGNGQWRTGTRHTWSLRLRTHLLIKWAEMNMDAVKRSTFSVPKMDCPSEENLIRLALSGVPELSLSFDLKQRQVTVLHRVPVNDVLGSWGCSLQEG